MTSTDIVMHVIPWGFTLLSLSFSLYVIIRNNHKDDKKEDKECAIETTTVIVKLENIQQAINRTADMITSIQNELKDHGNRLTKVETIVENLLKENNL